MALNRGFPSVGRPRKEGEILSVERPIKWAPSIYERMTEISRESGVSISEFVRRAVAEKLDAKNVIISDDPGLNTVRVPALATAPCGPFREAIAESDSFVTLSPDVAAELWFADGDCFVTARGDSMRSAGIIDGQRVLMTPLGAHQTPRRGDIVLVQITRDGEVCEATIKRWDGMDGALPRLLDGEDKPVKLPTKTEKVVAVAIGKSVMGRL